MIGRPLREILTDNKKKYGAIYRFDVGNMQTVFLTEYEDIVEAFKTGADKDKRQTKSQFQFYPCPMETRLAVDRVWLNQRGVAHMRGFDLDGDVVGLSSRVWSIVSSCFPKKVLIVFFYKGVWEQQVQGAQKVHHVCSLGYRGGKDLHGGCHRGGSQVSVDCIFYFSCNGFYFLGEQRLSI